jgi:proteasome accessory factor B
VSRKSERLVNLTIALLATKKWLSKSQIFSAVDGYEGEPEAMERMFERDKDELRSLGINIEVGTFDPLFDDEVGYRIRPDQYRTDVEQLTAVEMSLLTLATKIWQGAVLDSLALSGLVKLKSLGVDSDLDAIPSLSPRIVVPDEQLETIIDAIADRRTISFTYLSTDLESQSRVIEPYGAGTKNGYWYVAGNDIEKGAIRVFRLDRIDSEITPQGKSKSFQIPDSFTMATHLTAPEKVFSARLAIRRDKALALLNAGTVLQENDDWIDISYPYLRESELLEDVLWYLDDVKIIEPESAVIKIRQKLAEIVATHE